MALGAISLEQFSASGRRFRLLRQWIGARNCFRGRSPARILLVGGVLAGKQAHTHRGRGRNQH
jgi:hypothetical protein